MALRSWSLLVCVGLGCFAAAVRGAEPPPAPHSADVIVYGGTAAGVVAACAAADAGARVVLLEPGRHLGGMVSGGLGHTDFGHRQFIGGYARQFYQRVADHYQKPLWFYRGPEPKVAEQIFVEWLKQSGVEVRFEQRVAEVATHNRRITELRTISRERYTAPVFIDASYEGDLLARAGVSYVVGREGKSAYDESWAGRQPFRPNHHEFNVLVSPFVNRQDGKLLPCIQPQPLVEIGEGDAGIQSYCFRLCVTNVKKNQVPFPKPDGYDPARYELLRRWLALEGKRLSASNLMSLDANLPNGKGDVNSIGPFSTNLLDGSQFAYPDADYAQRDAIWSDHLRYTQGLLYFLANDPSVPAHIRDEMNRWGLPKDEFLDTGHWPHQLYVRQARRMLGEYVMTQHDLEGPQRLKYDAIGVGSYNIDIREVQRSWFHEHRYPNLVGRVFNESYLSVPVEPYEIPYRALLPRYRECENLLVTCCLSASHVAYASLRMEPQYMIVGHAAGVAGAMAADAQLPVHRIDLGALQSRLRAAGQILDVEKLPSARAAP